MLMKIMATALFLCTSINANFTAPQIPVDTQVKCEKQVCDSLRHNKCSSASVRAKVKDACTRQLDTKCLEQSLKKLKSWDYDSVEEITALAKSCQYVQSACVASLSKKLSSFEKDDLNEVIKLNDACWMVNPSCVNEFQSFLSSYDRDELEEVSSIGKYCQGTFKAGCLKKQCNSQGSYTCDNTWRTSVISRRCVHGPSRAQRRNL